MLSRRRFSKSVLFGSAATLLGLPPLIADPTPAQATPERIRFGVNFVPRKHWWYCWQDWDQQAILDDLEGIAALGLDHIRIQCLWSLFQPGINSVSQRSLANLRSLLDAAETAGLDVEVTVLNGWMSGFSYMPAWVLPVMPERSGETWNMFTSAPVIEAEDLLFRSIAMIIGDHKRFLGFDIGNELGVLMKKNNPVSSTQADAWASRMLRFCDEIAPGKFHVNGCDHSHWFDDFGFTRANLANTGHATVMHTYIYFDGVLQRYKYSDIGSLHLADFMVELGYAYQGDLKRKVWIEEIGVGNKEMPESYKPEYMEHTVRNVAATGKVWGITWWCSHDLNKTIKGFGDYEYELGLLDLNNRPKPMGKKFAALAAEFKHAQPEVVSRRTGIVIPDRGLFEGGYPPDWRYANAYMSLVRQGNTPAIVLESRAVDEAYLRSRGIGELIPCGC